MNRRWFVTRVCTVVSRCKSKLAKRQEGVLYGDEVVFNNKPSFSKSNAGIKDKVLSINDPRTNSFYPRLSQDDPKFCEALNIARGLCDRPPTYESQNRTVVLEGSRLIRDALKSGGQLLYLLFSSRELLDEIPNLSPTTTNVYYVPHKTLKQWSNLKTPSGILAIFRIPDQVNQNRSDSAVSTGWKPLPTTLILDNIRDPGNLGSLLRTAAGFGLPSVLISKGTVDIWNEKVIRSGMSAHFRVPIYPCLDWSAIGRCLTYAGYANQSTSTLPTVFVADIATKVTDRIISNRVDATVDEIDSSADPLGEYESDLDENGTLEKPLQLDSTGSAFHLPLSTVPHFAVDYFPESRDQRVALVIGGEARGLSSEAYHLAHLTGGSRIFVPTAPETESLNVLSAASAILGEMQRQYLAL